MTNTETCATTWDEPAIDADAIEFHDCTRITGHGDPCQCACGAQLTTTTRLHDIAGYSVPVDPMEDLQCDSCQ